MAKVANLSRAVSHQLGKTPCDEIFLLAGLGVQDDAHCGRTVQHLSRLAKTPAQSNLRQVHLIHSELFGQLRKQGFDLKPGQMGENITTEGLDLLSLPRGAILHIGQSVRIEITGLRNPCHQLDGLAKGLMRACLPRDATGHPMRIAGVMGTVGFGGWVRAQDQIVVKYPPKPWEALAPV